MADITSYLNSIKNAVLGKDVRSSIHDGIYAINKEVEGTTKSQNTLGQQFKNLVINAGNSNAEVASARGEFDYLPDRLDYVDIEISKPVTLDKCDSDLLSAIQNKEGETTFNLLSIPRDKSVTPKKTSFFTETVNLFNPAKLVVGKVISSTGVETANSSYSHTEMIDVEGFNYLSMHKKNKDGYGFNSIAFYNSEGAFIERKDLATNIDYALIGSNVKYIILNGENVYLTGYNVMVNEGSTLLEFSKYQDIIVKSDYLKIKKIEDKIVTPVKTTFINKTSNLFDISKIQRDKVISDTGILTDNTSYITTDLIEVDISQPIAMSNSKFMPYGFNNIIQWDENKIFISRRVLPTTQNYFSDFDTKTKYISFNAEKQYFDGFDIMVNEGSTLLDYEKYGEFLDEQYLLNKSISENEVIELVEERVKTTNDFIIQEIPSTDYVSNSELLLNTMDSLTYLNIYSKYDELKNKYSDYITSQVLGTETGGREIKEYILKPSTVSTTYNKLPKLLITTGIHGSEKPSVMAVLNLVNDICKNWQTNKILEFLRWNVELHIIPVLNPYGFDNQKRGNINHVDINRNFDYNWLNQGSSDPLDERYRGESANSEKETQILITWLNNNLDAKGLFDFHSYGSSEEVWNKKTKFETANDCNKVIWSKIGTSVIKDTTFSGWKNHNIPTDSGFTGLMGYNMSEGMLINYAKSKGIESSAPEVCYHFPNGENYTDDVNRFNVEFICNTLTNSLRVLL